LYQRTFRISLVVTLMVVLTMLLSALPVGAAARSLHQGHSFQPNGRSSVVPHKVSTFSTPQIKGKGHGPIASRPAPGGRAHVPSPSNVVRVPAPVQKNLGTKVTFAGQSENGWQPSDSNGGGGINNYLETVNEQFEIYSRKGAQQYGTDFNTWFGQSGSLFDPVVQWDKAGSRFMFIVDTGSSLLLSVAQQTNGLGNYCNYAFPTPSGYFADFEKLGVDADGVYFSVNLYGSPFTNELFFANRAQLESCQSTNYLFWTGLTNPDGSIAFAIVPARQDTSAGGVEYLVNSYPGGACQLTLWTLTSGGSLFNATVGTQCYSPPPPATQAGSAGTIDAGDNRLYQASYINGLLTLDTVGSYDWGDGNGPVGIVEWFVLNPSSASVFSQGAFGTPGYWLFYPATIRNYVGHLLFVYDASGPSIDPSIWYTNQSLSTTLALASGVSYYGTSGTARWGDYQSAWLDPISGSKNTVWITGQYAAGTNYWGTKVGRVVP
jgi:hypothetical protein